MGQKPCCEGRPTHEAIPEVVQHSSWPEQDERNERVDRADRIEFSQPQVETEVEEVEAGEVQDKTDSGIPSMMVARKSRNLFTLKHFKIDRSLLRGIPLRESLRSCGSLWVTSPVELQDADRAGLWKKSRNVESLDTFLSHTWQTSGWRKFLALLMQSGTAWFLTGWVIGATLGAVLDIMDILPPTASYECMDGNCQRGIWIRCFGFFGSAIGLLASPYAPSFFAGTQMCFLDVVSINQVDPDLMDRGIYGLGGFLAASSELRILWSPPYLSRLCCVFELAAFKKANPHGKVVLKPLFMETLIFSLILAIYGIVAIEEIRFMIRLNRNSNGESDGDTDSADSTLFGAGGIEALVGGLLLLPTIWMLHVIRKLFREKKELISNLRSFDLDKVACRTERDKNFIHSGIRAWYGSTDAFVEHVKGPLADELTEPFGRTDLPTTSWLMLATPFAAATLDFFVNQCQSTGVPKEGLFWLFLNRVVSANLSMLLQLRLVLYLCDRFAAAETTRVRDFAKSVFLWLVEGAVIAGWRAAINRSQQPAMILTICFVAVSLALFVFGDPKRWKRCCSRSSNSTEREIDNSAV